MSTKETLEEFLDRLEQEVEPIISEEYQETLEEVMDRLKQEKVFKDFEGKLEKYIDENGMKTDEISQKKDIGIFGWILAAAICIIVATGFIFMAVVVAIITAFSNTLSWLKSTTMRLFSR